MTTVYLNGRYVEKEQATVSVEDRGLQLGDGIYEVIRVYGGKLFALDRHLDRFERSAAAIELPLPSREELVQAFEELIRRDGAREALLYVQATRGPAPRGHAFPRQVKPTIIAYATPVTALDRSLYEQGAAVIVLPDRRWQMCNVKSTNLLLNVLAKEKAVRAGAYEALFEREGVGMTEGAHTNFFAVIDGQLRTAPAGQWILSGVTRDVVIELAAAEGIAVREEFFTRAQLMAASEVFLTGTNTEVMPVTRVDGQPVGDGKVGPITRRIMEAFAREVARFRG